MYSNFGYCILGRVIEKVSALTYLEFIKKHFQVDVAIAGNTIDQLLENESFYYDRDQEACFTMPLTRMDSCAGLVISPEELIKFAN